MSGLGNKADDVEWPDLPIVGLSDDVVQYEEGWTQVLVIHAQKETPPSKLIRVSHGK